MTFIKLLKHFLLTIVLAIGLIAVSSTSGVAQSAKMDAGSVSSVTAEPASGPARVVHVVDQDVAEFIREAARRDGFEVTLSRKIRGRIQRLTLPLDIMSILKSITAQFDLKWHFQQNHIFVSTGQENTTRLVYLGAMDMSELDSAMGKAGIKSETFEMSYVEESNSLLINGSVSYIAGIELLADAYNKNAVNRKSNVKIIRFGRVGS